MKRVIKFSNKDQVALYELELKDQLAGGVWSKVGPKKHWEPMVDAKATAVKGRERPGPNFVPPRRYNFRSKKVLAAAGPRMVAYVGLARAYDYKLEELKYVKTLVDRRGRYAGVPKAQGPYWDEVREKLKGIDPERVKRAISESGYSKTDLNKDLLAMLKAVNTAAA